MYFFSYLISGSLSLTISAHTICHLISTSQDPIFGDKMLQKLPTHPRHHFHFDCSNHNPLCHNQYSRFLFFRGAGVSNIQELYICHINIREFRLSAKFCHCPAHFGPFLQPCCHHANHKILPSSPSPSGSTTSFSPASSTFHNNATSSSF